MVAMNHEHYVLCIAELDRRYALRSEASRQYVEPNVKRAPHIFTKLRGDETLLELAERGMSAAKIKKRLNLPYTVRQIQNHILRKLGPESVGSNSLDNRLENIRPYVEEAMRRLGKDPYWCECCEERQTKPGVIHHTRYEGATVYDLVYVCTSCNNSRGNTGLS